MKEITRIDPASSAKMSAVLFSILGILLGMVVYLSYLVTLYLTAVKGPEGKPSIPEEALATNQFSLPVILYTIVLYALAGYFIGYVGAFIYNMLAPRIGGIQIAITEKARL